MIIKLAELVNSVDSLREIQEVKLPVKISYRIARLAVKLQPELTVYEEKKNEIIKELGEQTDDGYKIEKKNNPEKFEEYLKRLSELLQVEVEVDFERLKVEDLGECIVAPKLLTLFIFE